jgi:ubiquinone/menaquinone biosynthesis C-methylase UbiE
MEMNPQELQKEYYATTARDYDNQHLLHGGEHFLALNYLDGIIKFNNFKSVLDIGAGTGRVAFFLQQRNPEIKVISIEPVKELRDIGHSKGLKNEELVDGDIYNLNFEDSSVDLICAFGVFHHLEKPFAALEEMKRVSSRAVFISDSNNFGQGNKSSRSIKQFFNALKIWRIIIALKTRGKMYSISEGDGLAYSFSVFNLLKKLDAQYSLYFLSTVPSTRNLYRSASHLAILAMKNK